MKLINLVRQRGVTLFELLLVLFVAAFVAVAVAAIYNKVNTTYKTNALFNDTNQMAANMRSLFGGSGGVYSNLSPTQAVTAGIVPDGMHNGNVAIHPFSSAANSWAIAAVNSGAEFSITLNFLPQSVCVDFSSKALGVAQSVKAGNQTVTDVSSAITGCSAPTDTNSVTLTYN